MTALPDVEDLLAEAVADGTVPHDVVVVANMDGVREGVAVGPRAAGAPEQIRADDVFRWPR